MKELTADQVIAWLPRRMLRSWQRLTTRVRRAVWVAVGVPVVLFLSSTPAYADGSTAPAALSWINVTDSHGVSIWQYEMSLDRGGVRHPVRAVWAIFVDLFWQLYRIYIALACWLVDWTLSMDWIGWIAAPVMNLGDGLHQVVAKFGAVNALLTITAVAAVLWMARGRWVLGIFELFMSLVIASLAVGILSNPVSLIAGDDGALLKSRDVGLAVAAGLQNGDTTGASSDELRHQATGMIAETFLRKPQQLVNFGQVIDGTGCEEKYDEKIKKGPFGDDDDLRDAMGDCKDELGEVAENPNAGMFTSLAVLLPAGLVVVTFAMILCGVILIAGIYALYQSLKMIVALVMALLPGGARGSLWMTFAELIISMVTIIFSVVFLAAYLLLIDSVFETGNSPMATFFIVDVLLVVGIAVFWKGRKRIKSATERLASAMAKRPGGGGPTSLPQKMRFNAAETYYKARLATQGARVAGGVAGATGKATGSAVVGAGKLAGKAAYGPIDRTRGRIGVSLAAARMNGENSDPGGQLKKRLALSGGTSRKGQLMRVATNVGLAVATGGTSAAATTGAKTVAWQATRRSAQQAAIGGARRAALSGRLRPALTSGSSAGSGDPSEPAPAAPPPGTARSPLTAIGSGHSSGPQAGPGQIVRPSSTPIVGGMSPSSATSPKPGITEAQLRARLAARRRPIALGPAPDRSGK